MSQTKSLVSTEKTSVVFNHFPLASLDGFMTNHKVKKMTMDGRSDLSDIRWE